MRVLLSGFAPFGGSKLNPSWEAVRRLDGIQTADTVDIYATKLPVSYREASERLLASIRVICPDIVIAVGQAGGRDAITPEIYAMNKDDSDKSDNEGTVRINQKILEGGPDRYMTDLPVHEIVAAVQNRNIPSRISEHAGMFVCNDLFYKLMHALELSSRPMIGGFIHVPYLPEQVTDVADTEAPSLSVDQITEALREAAIVSAKVFSEKIADIS
ncbi:pyroglutamyl-peptidase I [Sporolactobacillus sp. CPB3-1]|uniref:Pyrrolidone-carboxylate peptidase n=1 Tax=Sporolactobacillus mangiferae TaxID=2940498 RepID=A0ABT0M7J9_9BACL|nr:pyroglutamyl-peptidase I [Sporolactobacillus mangiferae]MCL1630831.1 pyroglutamyl-peptidase I [Sporolactobacillus mangiferae]